jgi:hypothetical protein
MEPKKSSLNHDGSDEYLLHHSGDGGASTVVKTGFRWSTISGRRLLFATCACLAAASLFGLMSIMVWTNQSKSPVPLDQEGQQLEISKPTVDEWGPLSVLRGPPAESLWGASKCTPFAINQMNRSWQTTCATIQNIYHHGLLRAGVRALISFYDGAND